MMVTGQVAILNCTDGDTRVSFNTRNKEDVQRAKGIIEDMLRRGYCIAIDVGDGKYERVVAFDPTASEYIVQGVPAASEQKDAPAPKKSHKAKRGAVLTRHKARDVKAVAVGPTAGGGLGHRAFPPNLQALSAARGGQG